MPIKGLTDRPPRWPRVGVLRKGEEKGENRPGRDLTYFRYTSEQNPKSVAAFYNAYGKEPRAISVMLPYADVESNFSAWQEEWKASRMLHRCDGETVHRFYDAENHRYVKPNKPMPCPGNCKPVGRLDVIVPALVAEGFVGTVTLKTKSKWDITNIDSALRAYYQLRGDLRGVDFILYRYPEEKPSPDGPRREHWFVNIKASQDWVTAQLSNLRREALALPPGDDRTIDPDTGEILEGEFDDVTDDEPTAPVTEQTQRPAPGANDKRGTQAPTQQKKREGERFDEDVLIQRASTAVDLTVFANAAAKLFDKTMAEIVSILRLHYDDFHYDPEFNDEYLGVVDSRLAELAEQGK